MIELKILKFLTLTSILLIACYTDFKNFKIHNGLIIFGLISGLSLSIIDNNLVGFTNSLVSVFTAFVTFIPLYFFRGMAAGDVKLCMVVASFTGMSQWFQTAATIYILGGLIAIATVFYRKKFKQFFSNISLLLFLRLNKVDLHLSDDNQSAGLKSVGRMPFALAITAGTLATYIRLGSFPFNT